MMILQSIKAWFYKLFAWWPWKRPAKSYSAATLQISKDITQEPLWRSAIEAPIPQAGITSVIVEHGASDSLPEPQPIIGDDLSERLFSPPNYDELPPFPHILPSMIGQDTSISSEKGSALSPLHEQQLEFLRYLVHQGVVNEGFAFDDIPAQYQSKEEE